MTTMTMSFPGGVRVEAEFRGHKIMTDQPAKLDGEDSAPAPFSYFLASIGTCAAFYVLRFCQQRELSTEGIHVVQHHEFHPKTDKLECLRIEIQVPTDFPQKYYKALVRSVDQCAVKKTILAPPDFEIETVAVGE